MSLTRWLARRIADYSDPRSIGSRLRARRARPLLRLIEDAYAKNGSVSIIDVGGTEAYWNIIPGEFLDAHAVSITLVNVPGTGVVGERGRFRVVEGDGCDLSEFATGSFDIAHSNSVIEHVGDRERMAAFGREIARVASVYFLQTPNYWFPIEPHAMTPLFHWLPRSLRTRLVMRFALGHWRRGENLADAQAVVDSARLLRKRELQAMLPTARISTEWFVGLPKSLVAIGKGSGETA